MTIVVKWYACAYYAYIMWAPLIFSTIDFGLIPRQYTPMLRIEFFNQDSNPYSLRAVQKVTKVTHMAAHGN